MKIGRRTCGRILAALAVIWVTVSPARAIEVGEPAPDFRLPSTVGKDISLSDYRGKNWVLLEFYGADFSPT
jgi:AhpC/TSA family